MPLSDNRVTAMAFAAGFGLAGIATGAGAMPTAFPANQNLLPLVVGGAFALPALAALTYAMLWRGVRRLRHRGLRTVRSIAHLAGVAVLAVAALAIAGYLQPGLIPFRGG